ncbi:hypothetical protein CN639_07580 [Bacillus toyonensis]|nr:hypothetical protein CN906_25820 [Bacillus toyonensis]PEK51749.1 hypothetical protein CN588_07255 [Bacillus toyonensis]PEM92549.1 hypothetical protein CN639_07580 [Bacillus toyonensis]PEN63928.1 hypothetical protein CN545_27310 [Bacillus toyonensis]PFZ34307.1 hypothetical protein COL64_22725 [Bacillus toyonensis]
MKFISAVFQIYQRFSIYIGDFQNISAISQIYRLTDKKRQNKKSPHIQMRTPSNHLFTEKRSNCVNPGSKFISPL